MQFNVIYVHVLCSDVAQYVLIQTLVMQDP